MSRTRNSAKMILASSLCQFVILICGLILPPLLINHYGSEVNGFINLVKQIMSYFGVVCLGLGVSAQVALYDPLSKRDWTSINKILASTRYFFNKSSIYFSILVLLGSLILPLVLKTNISSLEIILIFIITGVGAICEYVIITKYKVFLAADQKQYINSIVTAEGILLNTIISVVLIKTYASIVIIQLASTVVYILRLLTTIRYVSKHYPYLSFTQAKPDENLLKDRWKAFFYQLSGMIINLSPIIIISLIGNLSDASIFSVYFMIFSSLAMIANIFSSGLSAPFGDIIVSNNHFHLKKAFSAFEFMYTTVLTCCFFIICVILCSFVGSYIHNTDDVQYVRPTFALLMSVYFFVRNYRIPYTTIVEAKGLFKYNGSYNIVEALAFIVLSILLVYKFSLNGIPIAGIITSLPRTLHYIVFCKKEFVDIFNFNLIVLKLFILVSVGLISFFVIRLEPSDSILSWIISALPYILISALFAIIINIALGFNNFKMFLKKINNILH